MPDARPLYYGDPKAFRAYNRNVTSLDQDFDDVVATLDGMVRPKLEADLYVVFASFPAPDSTQQNLVSVLWVYAMTEELQSSAGATALSRSQGYEEKTETKYEQLLGKISAARAVVPGAVRVAGKPKVSAFTGQRVKMSERQEPVEILGTFQHGLRGT